MPIDPALLLTAVEERRARLGELRGNDRPLTFVEVASQVGTHSATFSRLKNGRLPGEETMDRLLSWLNMDEEAVSECADCPEFTVIGDVGLPVADRELAWDGGGAATRVFDFYTDGDSVDTTSIAKAFLWRDPDGDPETKAAYSLGFADIVNDTLQIVPRGVAATAGGRGVDATDIPEDDKDAVKSRICTLYAAIRDKFEDWPECPFEAVAAAAATEDGRVAAIVATGSLSQSEDPDTQAAVTRVTELLNEGAVGVSIRHDLNPDDMPSQEEIDRLIEEERWEELDELFENLQIRPRHAAIVDTAAFADARLTVDADGNVTGPVAFEGTWTGDVRVLPYGSLVWDDVLPIPIIWDREDNDHDGMVVGSVTGLERQDGVTSAMRGPEPSAEDVAAVAAAAGGGMDGLPARYFEKFSAAGVRPLHVKQPDERRLRRFYGHAVPRGVCHRSDMGACFQYPGDVDKELRHFHTGQAVTLDNGETIRVGAITVGGLHIDTNLARRGVTAREINRHREDANQVIALVRAWEDNHGLAVSGVLVPSVDEATLMKAMACAPSAELWPSGRGRTLVGIHLVPTPAWPVVASAGEAMALSSPSQALRVEMEEVEVDLRDHMTVHQHFGTEDLEDLKTSLHRIETALGLLAADALTDVPEPSE